MGLKTMSLTSAATISVSGGSALAFADDGTLVSNGLHLIVPADADYKTRRSITVKNRPPSYDAKLIRWSKDKKSVTLVVPQVLADGSTVFNTLRLEREVHPDLAAATATEMNKLGAQLLTDTDLDAFWSTGSLT